MDISRGGLRGGGLPWSKGSAEVVLRKKNCFEIYEELRGGA